MVPFAGWEMPLQYHGILSEARAVRSTVGLFDVSHMGRILLSGPDASTLLDRILTFPIERLSPGRARYSFVLTESGGILDDVVIYRLGDSYRAEPRFLLVCNANTRETVNSWTTNWGQDLSQITIQDCTHDTTMIAIQGPKSTELIAHILPKETLPPRPFTLTEPRHSPLFVCEASEMVEERLGPLLSRTGYTGEDGFELIVDNQVADSLWQRLIQSGGIPCGLGARDLLRLEAGLLLSGTDIHPGFSPIEAGVERFVAFEQSDFVGKKALLFQKLKGVERKLIGILMQGQGIPRHDYPILHKSIVVGHVTSGGYSPTLDTGIALGYVSINSSTVGTQLSIDLRGRHVLGTVVSLPFYQRK